MVKRVKKNHDLQDLRNSILGLGEKSFHKSYYPQLQKRIRELQRFRLLLDHSHEYMFIFDVPSGNILDINKPAIALWDIKEQELNNLSMRRIVGEDTWQTMVSFIKETHLNTSDKTFLVDFHPNETDIIYLEMNLTIHQIDGVPNGIILARDITQQITEAKLREELIEQLERKITEMEAFTYTVSHDLKGPLLTIKCFLDILQKDFDNNVLSDVNEHIARMTKAAVKMRQLLDGLLELCKVGNIIGKIEEIDLSELIDTALELLASKLYNHTIKIEIQDGLPAVHGDRERLMDVMLNLIDNAIKAVDNRPDARISIGVKSDMDPPVFFVRDNGIGIEPQYINKIFALFEKFNPHTEGTGIGLAHVKRIIESHHGTIWAESEGIGKGTTIFFTLPEEPDNTEHPPA